MPTVEFQNILKQFGAVTVLEDLNLRVEDGEFLVLLGPSGCGKTTLLNLLAGLLDVTDGTIRIGDRDVTDLDPKDRGLAMVFQSYALYPTMTVEGNLRFGLSSQKLSRAEMAERVAWAAKLLQIVPLLNRKPAQLSGGQRQRVAIGRALVKNVDVFLFDEPLSNLDAKLRTEMRLEIKRLHDELRKTVVYVTHDQIEAMTMASRIVVLNAGIVEQVGAPLELYHNPINRFVAGFIGSPKMNFLPCKLVSADAREAKVALPDGTDVTVAVDATRASAGDDLTLGVRPEHFLLRTGEAAGEGAGNTVRGEVVLVENLGESTLIYLKQDKIEALTLCRTEGTSPAKEGEPIEVTLAPTVAYLFDMDGKAFTRTADDAALRRAS
jgi:multiple sugar transport system ATP-binding protein